MFRSQGIQIFKCVRYQIYLFLANLHTMSYRYYCSFEVTFSILSVEYWIVSNWNLAIADKLFDCI